MHKPFYMHVHVYIVGCCFFDFQVQIIMGKNLNTYKGIIDYTSLYSLIIKIL